VRQPGNSDKNIVFLMQDKLIWTRDKFQVDLVFFPLYEAVCSFKRAVGDRPQGVAGDCNSLAETHAWFDSRVAHHYRLISLDVFATILLCLIIA
jgi:hypothetical protein